MVNVTHDAQAEKNLRWNFAVNLLDITFFTLGLSLVSRETIMPVLVSSLTDSRFAVGLVPAIFSLCYYLPQLLFANYAERLRYKKPFVLLVGGLGERIPYLLIGVVIWLLAEPAPAVALTLFFVLLGIGASCSGAATPAWYDMIAKVIPIQRRGVWFGIGHSLGALMGVIGAFFVGRILELAAFPNNFALCFMLATAALAVSFGGLALNREPPSSTVKASQPLHRYLRQLPAVIRRDRNYARFLLSRTTMQLGAMATGFFMVYGRDRFQVDGAGVGLLTAVLIASQALMNPIWGLIGDRRGYKIVLVSAALLTALTALSAWLAQSQAWLIITFLLLGVAQAADGVAALNIILEFCAAADRPTYIGLTNTLLAPTLTLAPLLGGWLAVTAGYRGLFLAALIIAALGGALLAFLVREPRTSPRPNEEYVRV